MLQPFLLVGVGGSGGKTLRALRHALELRLQQEDWTEGWPKAWQMIHVDSPVSQDGAAFPADFLPSENYFPLVAPGTSYKQAFDSVVANLPAQFKADIEKSLPSPKEVNVDVTIGAGKYRAIGRTLVLAKIGQVSNAANEAFGRMMSDGALGQLDTLGRKLGAKPAAGQPNPVIIVISSIAGGSGAGQYIEVTEAIKAANRSAPFIHSIFSILYAPDVFKSVGDTNVIAPNALFAMAESMAGMWSNDLPEATAALYKKVGIEIPGLGIDPRIHIGPRFNYVIGRQNSKVTFEDQPDVYKAVSASLTTWLTDENVQDGLQAYTVANYSANTGAMALTDNSDLQVANKHTPPFSSLGFGRVSLGRDKFTDYSAERLARTTIDRMLFAHIDGADTTVRTEDQIVDQKASQSFPDYLMDLKLTRPSDKEIDAATLTRSDREALGAEVKNQISNFAQGGLSAKSGAMPVKDWVDAMSTAYQAIENADRSDFVKQERESRNGKIRGWVGDTKYATMKVTSRYISQQGVKVGINLLKRLEDELHIQASQLLKMRDEYAAWGKDYLGAINNDFQAVQGGAAIKPDHPAVLSALEQLKNCFWYSREADHVGNVSELLEDFATNFVKPLKDSLSQGENALLKLIDKSNASDHVQNAYEDWPKPESDGVPRKYESAPNEYLLVSTSDYSSEFKRLVDESVETSRRANSRQVVVDEVLMGSLQLDNLDPNRTWSLLSESKPWIPNTREFRADSSQSQQPATFNFSNNPLEYLQRSHYWLQRKGQSFHRYLHDDIATYLDANVVDASLLVDRQRRFREQFLEAVRASEPLVKLNPALLMEIHNSSIEDRESVLSVLPFDRGSSMYELIKEILIQQKMWDETKGDSWFNSSAKVQNIDFFSVQKPYQPMVMDSIFGPVAQSWNEAENNMKKRENFLAFRRSRPLWETVPAAPEKKSAILRGWFVARLLGQLTETLDSEDSERGPLLTVWSGKTYQQEAFPHPLAHPDIVEPQDYPGALLNSLAIALAMVNSKSSLAPLYPYQRLMELGEVKNPARSELVKWVTSGELKFKDQPTPNPTNAGSPKDTADDRRGKVSAYFNAILEKFKIDIEDLDTRTDWDRLNFTWEVRQEIREALETLISTTLDIQAEVSGIE